MLVETLNQEGEILSIKNENVEKSVLLKIHRQYKKDESIKVFTNEISNLKFKIGELQSEIAELKHLNREGLTLEGPEWTKDEAVVLLKRKNTDLKLTLKKSNAEKERAFKDAKEWKAKYFSLLAKNIANVNLIQQ